MRASKHKVLKRHPRAASECRDGWWRVTGGGFCIGVGNTPAEAWADAYRDVIWDDWRERQTNALCDLE